MIMSNLFVIFDPTCSLLSFSWFSFLLFFFLFPGFFWVGGLISYMILGFLFFVKLEVNFVIKFPFKGCYLMMTSLFLVVLIMNFLAMFPFLFSLTSHLLVTLPMSYSFWFGVIFFSWVFSLKHFLSHLIPLGTPLGLMSFMVLVEILSNFIRPLALTFRLTANMMAGHLLMSLIGSFLVSLPLGFLILGSLVQSLLVFMELGVSVIQSYVFSTLILLYISEGEV